jgi:hypothetical protein
MAKAAQSLLPLVDAKVFHFTHKSVEVGGVIGDEVANLLSLNAE